jgi:hypothetical protein
MLPDITRELAAKGYPAGDIIKVLGENFMGLFAGYATINNKIWRGDD